MTRRIIGLTGGIATGKTTVSNYLAHHYHIPILDADIYAREAVQVGSQILETIFLRYGKDIKLDNGTLNRKKLGEIIFNNTDEKAWLEQQIHPYVRQCFQIQLQKIDTQTIVLSIPLLFEAKMTDLVTEIWVVYCSFEEQVERLMKRDRLTQEQAITRINNQLSIEQKIALADIILDNSSGLESLYRQIDKALILASDNY